MKFTVSILLTLIFAFSVFAQKQAEVIVTSTYLRSEPNTTSEKLQTLQQGDLVKLEKSGENKGWFYVSKIGETTKGWIRKDTISEPKNVEKPKVAAPEVSPEKPADKPISTPKPTPAPKPFSTPKPNNTSPKKPAPEIIVIPPTPQLSPEQTKVDSPIVPEIQPTVTPTPAPLPADAPPVIEEDNEVLKINTDEVSLNVRVVNAANRPVGNLSENQFRIYEDDVLQPITALVTTEVPMINALVIDNSRSLRSQLTKIIEAGKIIVGTNKEKDETAIVRFVSADKIEVVQDFTTGKPALENALDNLFVEGGQTAIIDAIYQTAKKVEKYQNSGGKDDIRLRSLILVSDGDDRASRYSEQQLFKLLRDSNVQIYAVGFTENLSDVPESDNLSRRQKAKDFLTRLAQETGGKVFFPANIDELPQIARDISGELRTQYTVSYSPTNETRDGGFRKIRVEIVEGANNEKRTAITRTGRNAQQK